MDGTSGSIPPVASGKSSSHQSGISLTPSSSAAPYLPSTSAHGSTSGMGPNQGTGGDSRISPTPLPLPTLYPPENFTQVSGQVYRSGFPRRKHLPFLQHMGLRSILTLVLEEYPDGNLAWMDRTKVKLYQFGVAGNKEPFVDIPEEVIADALAVLLGEFPFCS